jgi:hypothetical protein
MALAYGWENRIIQQMHGRPGGFGLVESQVSWAEATRWGVSNPHMGAGSAAQNWSFLQAAATPGMPARTPGVRGYPYGEGYGIFGMHTPIFPGASGTGQAGRPYARAPFADMGDLRPGDVPVGATPPMPGGGAFPGVHRFEFTFRLVYPNGAPGGSGSVAIDSTGASRSSGNISATQTNQIKRAGGVAGGPSMQR